MSSGVPAHTRWRARSPALACPLGSAGSSHPLVQSVFDTEDFAVSLGDDRIGRRGVNSDAPHRTLQFRVSIKWISPAVAEAYGPVKGDPRVPAPRRCLWSRYFRSSALRAALQPSTMRT
jgi:hypothetical protein